MANGFEPSQVGSASAIETLLEQFALKLRPWAERTAKKMILEVNDRDRESWRALGNTVSAQLRNDLLGAPLGARVRELLSLQVGLIQSIPLEAARRVHELTAQGLEGSRRHQEIAKEIARTGEVSQSRATLIARTEVSRTASVLTQARAEHAGSTQYIWRTAGDHDVREGHKEMAGKVCEWANPPAVNESGRVMHFHPGQIWNCRCYAEPIFADDPPQLAPPARKRNSPPPPRLVPVGPVKAPKPQGPPPITLDDGTNRGAWNQQSLAQSPRWAQALAADTPLTAKNTSTVSGAYFDAANGIIEMGNRTTTSRHAQNVWRHEMGHAIDYRLQPALFRWRSQGKDWIDAMNADSKELVDARATAASTPEAEGSGIDEKHLDEFLEKHTVLTSHYSPDEVRAIKLRIASAWRRRDIQDLVDCMLSRRVFGPGQGWLAGCLGNLSDLAGATTLNKLCAHSGGYFGHSDSYYASVGYQRGTEAFANVFALLSDETAFAAAIVERFFPAQARVFRALL